MATWNDVREIALGLLETNEQPSRGSAFWRVRDTGFVWERPRRQLNAPRRLAEANAAELGPG